LRLIITELPQPLVVRRYVSFAEAVYAGKCQVEGVTAVLASDLEQAFEIISAGNIPVLVDPEAGILSELRRNEAQQVLVDARMTKQPSETSMTSASLVIGLGPGCVAGQNCHAVIETIRGHQLGRVIWEGETEADTGVPEMVLKQGNARVLRAPVQGIVQIHAQIGDHVEAGQVVAEVDGIPVTTPFAGVIRGLIHPSVPVWTGMKIGDVDPRDDPRFCYLVSDKSLAVGGGVLEAILSTPSLRRFLWD
jgi:xanthine dehydrogenase accessory factor